MLLFIQKITPLEVCPDVMMQLAKSNTALVISDTSARVGLAFDYIDYKICIATITIY